MESTINPGLRPPKPEGNTPRVSIRGRAFPFTKPSPSPSNAGVQARYSNHPVGELIGDVHLPDDSWRSCLSDLKRFGSCRKERVSSGTNIHVPICEHID